MFIISSLLGLISEYFIVLLAGVSKSTSFRLFSINNSYGYGYDYGYGYAYGYG